MEGREVKGLTCMTMASGSYFTTLHSTDSWVWSCALVSFYVNLMTEVAEFDLQQLPSFYSFLPLSIMLNLQGLWGCSLLGTLS